MIKPKDDSKHKIIRKGLNNTIFEDDPEEPEPTNKWDGVFEDDSDV